MGGEDGEDFRVGGGDVGVEVCGWDAAARDEGADVAEEGVEVQRLVLASGDLADLDAFVGWGGQGGGGEEGGGDEGGTHFDGC